MIGTVGTKLESLEQVLRKLDGLWYCPRRQNNYGLPHYILFASLECWKPAFSSHMHIYPFAFIVSFFFFFLVQGGENELEGPRGGRSLRNLCSHGRLLGDGVRQERCGLAGLVRLGTLAGRASSIPGCTRPAGRATLPAFDLCSCAQLPPTEVCVLLLLPPFCAVRDSRLALGACFPGRAGLRAHPGAVKCPRRRSQAPPPAPQFKCRLGAASRAGRTSAQPAGSGAEPLPGGAPAGGSGRRPALPVSSRGGRSLLITHRANCPALNFRSRSEAELRGARGGRRCLGPGPARVKCPPVPGWAASSPSAGGRSHRPGDREVRPDHTGPPPPSPPLGGAESGGAPAWRGGRARRARGAARTPRWPMRSTGWTCQADGPTEWTAAGESSSSSM